MKRCDCDPLADVGRREFFAGTAAAVTAVGVAATAGLAATPAKAAAAVDKSIFMQEATRLAIESVEKGWGGPFDAIIVKDGEVVGRGQNRVLLTGCPVFHAEITAIMDASARLNPKALLGSDYGAGTILEMIPREAGSPDPVPERARMLKGCEIYINGAPCPMCMSASAGRASTTSISPPACRIRARSASTMPPIRRLRQALGQAADSDSRELRAEYRPQGVQGLDGQKRPPPLLRRPPQWLKSSGHSVTAIQFASPAPKQPRASRLLLALIARSGSAAGSSPIGGVSAVSLRRLDR